MILSHVLAENQFADMIKCYFFQARIYALVYVDQKSAHEL